jgi:hypothetical protein
MRNSSQDPEYEGLPYHEKKVHKTHFGVHGLKLKSSKPTDYTWVKIGNGRYKLIRNADAAQERGGRNATRTTA